ncbi:hypothetical protein BDV39DRAFT_180302 [Aspergillus sergii]|uniref:Uncharacterized protein n=1 Tax=Aspergillus sergii TaxID=1034303 RepID=A0A5N6WU71_9EURO|nr:hypothetical protein BDV39DRAFT_180302 [Aspergillus sergii]
MSSSPIMMIGAYVSDEVIALHDLLGIPRSMYARATLRVVVQVDADLPVGSCACSQKRQRSNVGCYNGTNTHWPIWNATNQFQY